MMEDELKSKFKLHSHASELYQIDSYKVVDAVSSVADKTRT
jgi:hypothetical protein